MWRNRAISWEEFPIHFHHIGDNKKMTGGKSIVVAEIHSESRTKHVKGENNERKVSINRERVVGF
jgi:hypothetical protein